MDIREDFPGVHGISCASATILADPCATKTPLSPQWQRPRTPMRSEAHNCGNSTILLNPVGPRAWEEHPAQWKEFPRSSTHLETLSSEDWPATRRAPGSTGRFCFEHVTDGPSGASDSACSWRRCASPSLNSTSKISFCSCALAITASVRTRRTNGGTAIKLQRNPESRRVSNRIQPTPVCS